MIDRAALAKLLGTDDPAIIGELLAEFVKTSREYSVELADAVAAGNFAAARRLAHRLSGSSRTLGAAALAEAAHDLETACVTKAGNVPVLYQVVASELARVLADISG